MVFCDTRNHCFTTDDVLHTMTQTRAQLTTFVSQYIVTAAANFITLDAGDIDKNGVLDFVIGDYYGQELSWIQGSVDNLTGLIHFSEILVDNTVYPTSVKLVDLDRDGWLDIVCASPNNFQVAWYRNLGSGTGFTKTVLLSSSVPAETTCGDIDQDGDTDILVSYHTRPGRILWFRNERNASSFTVMPAIVTTTGWLSTVQLADMDRDGDLDVIYSNVDSLQIAWSKNELGTIGTFVGMPVIASNCGNGYENVFVVADVNQDSLPDIVGCGSESGPGGTLLVIFNNISLQTPSAFVPRPTFIPFSPAGYSVAGDLDGDGFPDIISWTASGVVSWSRTNVRSGQPVSFTRMPDIGQIPLPNSAMRDNKCMVADVDNDSYLDVVCVQGQAVWFRNQRPSLNLINAPDAATTLL